MDTLDKEQLELLRKASEFFAKRETLLRSENPVYAKATMTGVKSVEPLLGIESRATEEFLNAEEKHGN